MSSRSCSAAAFPANAAAGACLPIPKGGARGWQDRGAPAYAILWRAAAGGSLYFGAFLATRHLSPEAQGFYFTIFSLLQLRTLFELGLNQLFVQSISHETPETYWCRSNLLHGSPQALMRIGAVVQFAVHWYLSAAVAMLALVGVGGWVYFSRFGTFHVEWHWAWLTGIVCTSLSLAITPGIVLLEGSGMVARVARMRAVDGTISGAVLVFGIRHGLGLAAIAAFAASGLIIQSTWTFIVASRAVRVLLRATPAALWRGAARELLPVQRRLAISWISGYLVFNGSNPIVMALCGPEFAGRLGFGLALGAGAVSLASAWLNVRATIFGRLIRSRDYTRLDALFRKVAILTGLFLAAILSAILLLLPLLTGMGLLKPDRIPHRMDLLWLFAGSAANYVTFALAIYLRAHKREPLVYLSLLNGMLFTGANVFVAPRLGLSSLCISYAVIQGVVIAPLTYIVFTRCRSTWHLPPQGATTCPPL